MENPRTKKRPFKQPDLFEMGKLPPQAIDMEELVLGAIMLERDALKKVFRILKVETFYKEAHQLIFKAISQLYQEREPIDIATVTFQCKKNGDLEKIGGPYYITQLTTRVVSSVNTEYHARIIYQMFLKREIIRIANEYANKAFEDTTDVFDLLSEMAEDIKRVDSIVENSSRNVNIKELVGEMSSSIQGNNIIFPEVYKIGDPIFDEYISIGKDKILLISGPAKGGKSKYVRYIMKKLLKNYPDDVAIKWVTLEDSAKDVIRGFVSRETLIKAKHIKQGRYDSGLNAQMMQMYSEFNQYDIEFIEVRTYIKTICDEFKLFCEKRPGKFNILIIDNILSMDDIHVFKSDSVGFGDYVMGEILKCRQETHGLIIPLHHYKDSQQDRGRINEAYRPALTDMKGSEAYRRVPNQVLLTNNPGLYKDLLLDYPKEIRDVLKYLFIVDTGANREDSNDESTIIRYLFNLDFDIFEEL